MANSAFSTNSFASPSGYSPDEAHRRYQTHRLEKIACPLCVVMTTTEFRDKFMAQPRITADIRPSTRDYYPFPSLVVPPPTVSKVYTLPGKTIIQVMPGDGLWPSTARPGVEPPYSTVNPGIYTVENYTTFASIRGAAGRFIAIPPRFNLIDQNGDRHILLLKGNQVRIEKIDGVPPRAWRKLRTAASIIPLQQRAAERTYAPGGLGAQQAQDSFEVARTFGVDSINTSRGGLKSRRNTRKSNKRARKSKKRKAR